MVCHEVHANALEYGNTFTPLDMVANHETTPYRFQGCAPVKLWFLVRHGARTLDINTRKAASKVLPTIRHHILYGHLNEKGELNKHTINAFKNWSEKLPLNENDIPLTPVGREEMYNLAERTRKRFMDFFKTNYSETEHKFHTRCKFWVRSVHKNSSTYLEFNRFATGPLMAETLIRISQRLGLNYTLHYGEVKLILKYCTAEGVWDGGYSPWCQIFSKEELEILDHADDIRKYYRHGYASEINYRQACPLVKDLINFLGDDSQETPQSQFLFSHSGSILKFITAMGLFRDETHLTKNNLLKRRWRGSYIDAFGSNFASVLYKCKDGVNKALTFYQERPVMIKNCDSLLCPLKVLQDNYKDYIKCDFDRICRNNRRKRDEYVNE
ncbi:hypothetical protein LSTR_LSTR011134 [Laodelphax striatellus]|uniref:Multiple inositol polyphosphate phosphatase 1 n=1 Tax=Laodelphax striatellus TaxID=195883 RepID=A0A482X1I2_LAOST|nr:hypothetical protein LSTR_LSTR011134 [Laodelphax striatellus]